MVHGCPKITCRSVACPRLSRTQIESRGPHRRSGYVKHNKIFGSTRIVGNHRAGISGCQHHIYIPHCTPAAHPRAPNPHPCASLTRSPAELPPSVDARPRAPSPKGSSSPTSPVDKFLTCIRAFAAELSRFQSPVQTPLPPPPPPPPLLLLLASRVSRHPSPASTIPSGDSGSVPCPAWGGVSKPPPPPLLPPGPSPVAEASTVPVPALAPAAPVALVATGLCSGVVVAVVDGVVVALIPAAFASSEGLGGRAAAVAAVTAPLAAAAADDEVRSDRSRDS